MGKIEFVLDFEVNGDLSLNKIYAGKSWHKRSREANEYHKLVKFKLMEQRIPKKIFRKPVRIEFFWNSMLDLDNHGYLTKLIIDGLKGYLIANDSKKYVRKITHAYWLGNGVKIKISEVLNES